MPASAPAPLPVIEDVAGDPVHRLTGVVDNVRFFDAEGAAGRWGRDAAHWTRQWSLTWGPILEAANVIPDSPFDDEPAAAPPDPASTAAATPGPALRVYSPQELARFAALRVQHYPHLDDAQWAMALETFRYHRVHPQSRMFFFEPRYDHVRKRQTLDVITSIHFLRLLAVRTGEFGGYVGPTLYCGEDREWVEVWTDRKNPPHAAKSGVIRRGFDNPFWGVATLEFYLPSVTELSGAGGVPESWARDRGVFQLGKCSRALALREAFPAELGSFYTPDEMEQAKAEGRQNRGRSVDAGEVVAAANAAADQGQAERQTIPDAPDFTDEGVEFSWDGFVLQLEDLGIDTPARQNAVVRMLKTKWPGAAAEEFYRRALAEVRRNPAAYGAAVREVARC